MIPNFKRLRARDFMPRNPVTIWIVLSFLTLFTGYLWNYLDAGSDTAFVMIFFGWASSLLAVGYYSTPSDSMYGKIAFAGVMVMVMGMAMKILHFLGANHLIVIGLLAIVVTYVTRWARERKLF